MVIYPVLNSKIFKGGGVGDGSSNWIAATPVS